MIRRIKCHVLRCTGMHESSLDCSEYNPGNEAGLSGE